MPLMTHWIGGRSLKSGSRISAVVIVVAIVIELVISIYSLVRMHSLKVNFSMTMQKSYFPPGILPLGYIKLCLVVMSIILTVFLVIWINQGYNKICQLKFWCGAISGMRIIELICGIYILAWIGGDNLSLIIVIAPELVAFAAFWVAVSLVMILCILGIVSYCAELKADYRRTMKESSSKPLQLNVPGKQAQARVIASYSKPWSQTQSEPQKPKKPRRYLKKGETRSVNYESGV